MVAALFLVRLFTFKMHAGPTITMVCLLSSQIHMTIEGSGREEWVAFYSINSALGFGGCSLCELGSS